MDVRQLAERLPHKLAEQLAKSPTVPLDDVDSLVRHEIVGLNFDRRDNLQSLRPSEIRTIEFLSHGLELEMIAQELCLSANTLHSQQRSARAVANAKNTTHLVALCLRAGIIK